ncbi:hypothetical protein GA0061099_1001967 [Bradyrhizobium yuanmingense]|uniref:Uncharacterized protein n=1 Tax=Bradyrhizobium yuanmingense TaxID=108015 RepID=A0A1C3UD11_9BRAD|nr:hypothetical protein IQ15_06178 [Bradyrhizobium yuanmingense]SCB13363.1 hypothetical protein GA0061099_1001967 [Bradyrhizobium yuanmingense]
MSPDRSRIRKGAVLTGGAYPARVGRLSPDMAEMFADVLKEAGPPPSAAKLEALAAERDALEAQMLAIKKRIAEIRRRACE